MQATIRVSRPRQLLLILCFLFLLVGIGGKSWGQTNPGVVYDLSTGSWTLMGWSPSVPAGRYPVNGATGLNATAGVSASATTSNMRFWKHGSGDPILTTTESSDVTTAYAGGNGTITGNGANGFFFDNTGAVGIGSAVLSVNTSNRTSIQVAWTGLTVTTGARPYAIRLQYRVGTTGTFLDASSTTSNILYASAASTGSTLMPIVTLPAAAEGQPIVQILWRFYYTGSVTGSRPALGVDEITVSSSAVTSTNYYWNGNNTTALNGTWDNTNTTPTPPNLWSTSPTTAPDAVWPASGTTNTANFINTSGGTVTLPGAITATPSNTNIGSSTYTFATGTADATLGGPITLNANTLNFVPSTGSITLTGNISGTGGSLVLNSSSTGNLNLSGTNSFTGGIVVNSSVLGGSRLRFDLPLASTTGTVRINTNGSLRFHAAGTYGTTSQILQLNPGQTTNTALDIDFAGDAIWQGPVSLLADTRIDATGSGNSIAFSGLVSGSGKIQKQGAGTLALSATAVNSNTGGVQMGNGTITVASTTSLGSNSTPGDVTFAASSNNDTKIILSNSAQTIGNLSTDWTKGATGTVAQTLTLNGTALTINQSAATTFGDGGTGFTSSITNGASAGSIIKTGSGALTLAGNNTYTGGTTITAGSIVLGKGDILDNTGPVTLNGGTFKTGASTGYNETVGTLSLTNSSTIALATGDHALKFTGTTATWTSGKTLTISGWMGTPGSSGTNGKVFIGSAGSVLTSAQLARITFTGFTGTAIQLSTGEVVPSPAAISVTPAPLTGFTYVQGSGPSASQFFAVSGSNFTPAAGNLTITGSADYEVSADNITFGTTASVAYTGGSLSSVNVYVRLKAGLLTGTYNSETITVSGGTAATSPAITVSGSVTAPVFTVSPASVAFGNMLAGAVSLGTSVTVSSSGLSGAPGLITVTAPSADFQVSTDNSTYSASITLPYTSSSFSATFYIRFSPQSTGAKLGNVTITGGSATIGNVAVTGTGTAPEIDITGNNVSIPSGNTTTSTTNNTDFGNAVVGVSTQSVTFSIKNTGTGPLSLTGTSPYVAINGANASDFTVTTIPAATIAAAGNTSFVIKFNPTAVGTRTASISIANTDADENPYTFAIQGTATNPAPEINLVGGSTNIATGGSYAFASTVSGASATAITFTIENTTGTATLTLTGTPKVAISGINASEFVINQAATTATVAAGGSTTFTITFSPVTTGAKTAQISIANNDADENPYIINLSGTATASAASDLIVDAAFTYNGDAAIDYRNYQATNIPSDGTGSIDVFRFTVRDGGSTTDADNLPTILNSITFSSVQNVASIRDAALFDGSVLVSNVASINTTNSTLAFSGLSGTHVTAPDGSTKTLTLRVSFKTAVTEQQLQFSITFANVATGSGTSSSFGAFTTVQSSVSPATRNKVSVVATALTYQQQPSNVAAGTVMTPAVKVAAIDANGNIDVDFTSTVTLSVTSTSVCNTLSGNTANAVSGIATFSSLKVSTAETGITLTATASGLTGVLSNTFNVTGSGSVLTTLVSWNFEDGNTTQDGGTAINATNVISTNTIVVTPYPTGSEGTGSKSISSNTWNNGINSKYWLVSVNATGYQSLAVSSKQSSSNDGPRNFKIQYQLNGTAGTWTDFYTVPDMTIGTSGTLFTQGIASSVSLPAACNNQSLIYIRWVMSSNVSSDGGTVTANGTSRIDEINITGESVTTASNLYYRSSQNGNFGAACNWESSSDGTTWAAATAPPDLSSKTISIRSGYTININSTRTVDELVVDNGGILVLNNFILTINNGTGTDFIVNGTFQDNSTTANSVAFNTDAKWQLGANGTFIKSNTSSAAVYRDNYEGGMSTIPATANWIIRKSTATGVEFTTVDTYYPNLTFDNTSGTPYIFSSTAGNSGYMRVLGNLDVGGASASAANAVTFVNNNYNSSPLLVNANIIVRAGSVLTNSAATPGTGFEVKGNISVDGTVTANGGNNTGVFNFTGNTQQTVSGAGAINLNNVTINNIATATAKGVLLSRDISVGGLLTLTNGPFIISGKTLTLNGGVSHTNGSITGSATSNLVLNGSSAKALYFTSPGNVLHNVTINTSAINVSLDNALDITAGSSFGTMISNGTLQTNGYLTLKSDIGGTAAVGNSSGSISGNVTVERYTDGNLNAGQSRRAWRLITSPISGQTIRQAWQENGSNATSFGTLITGENMPDAITAAAQGYDFTGAGFHASIKHYVAASNSWMPLSSDGSITGTKIPIRNEQAYMLFVRGDRSVTTSGSSIATLRATGTLLQGTQTAVPLSGGVYTLMGNPYASSIDFASIYNHNVINNNPQIQNQFYIWNSKLGTYGAYALVRLNPDNSGNYQAVPSSMSGLGTQNNDTYRYIPSGSGFFVFPNAGATTGVVIQESDKALTGVPPISPFRIVQASNVRQLFVNLNLKDSDTTVTLADGFLAAFSYDYKGNESDNSTHKVSNFNENLGLVRDNTDFIVEARAEVKKSDTLYMRMWYVTKRQYQLQVQGDNFATAPGIRAWLEDNYLGTKQELALAGSVTTINFEVNTDSASSKSDRFRIVFENNTSVLPVTITKVKAAPSNGGVEVSWTVANEVNVKGYTIEKSADGGRTFTDMGSQQPAHNNAQAAVTGYSGYDAQPKMGDNFYRIRIEAKDGTITYSEVVKVTIGASGAGIQITLYPNPVREGKANLSLSNLKAGAYLVSVYTGSGQTVYQKKVYITLANTTQTEQLILGSNIAQGSYQIKVSDNKGKVIKEKSFVVIK